MKYYKYNEKANIFSCFLSKNTFFQMFDFKLQCLDALFNGPIVWLCVAMSLCCHKNDCKLHPCFNWSNHIHISDDPVCSLRPETVCFGSNVNYELRTQSRE